MTKAPILTLAVFAAAGFAGTALLTTGARPNTAGDASGGRAHATNPDASTTPAGQIGENRRPNHPAETGEMTAGELLRRARGQLRAFRSVKARLIETANIGDRKFRATGTYLQGSDFKLKMALHVRLGEENEFNGSMLQVCDGQVLWTSHRLGESSQGDRFSGEGESEQRITRRDVRQIISEVARQGETRQNRLVAELGLGGISEMLASLEQTMVFGPVRRERVDRHQFLVVQGRWNVEVLKNFLDAEELEKLRSAEDGKLLPRLPEHVPDAARIYFDPDNDFPRRILYLKRPKSGESLQPMLSLNFVDVVLNGPVNDDAFNFVPPDKVYPQDVTPQYLEQIHPARTADAAGAKR